MKREEIARGFSLVQAIEADQQSSEFRRPVDYAGLGLDDYLTIVKKPMDFFTIKVLY